MECSQGCTGQLFPWPLLDTVIKCQSPGAIRFPLCISKMINMFIMTFQVDEWVVVSISIMELCSSRVVGGGDTYLSFRLSLSRLGRAFTVLFLLIGVMMIALLQSWVIDHLNTSRDVFVQQLQKASDVLNGVKVSFWRQWVGRANH